MCSPCGLLCVGQIRAPQQKFHPRVSDVRCASRPRGCAQDRGETPCRVRCSVGCERSASEFRTHYAVDGRSPTTSDRISCSAWRSFNRLVAKGVDRRKHGHSETPTRPGIRGTRFLRRDRVSIPSRAVVHGCFPDRRVPDHTRTFWKRVGRAICLSATRRRPRSWGSA